MNKEDILKLKNRILDFQNEIDEIENKAFLLGKRKMFIFGKGFRKFNKKAIFNDFCKANLDEKVYFENDYITVTYTDYHYDLYDSTSIKLTWEELFLSEEENIKNWEKEYTELVLKQEEELKLRKEEVEKARKLATEKYERKEYLRLKKKYKNK